MEKSFFDECDYKIFGEYVRENRVEMVRDMVNETSRGNWLITYVSTRASDYHKNILMIVMLYYNASEEVIKVLLDAGADPNYRSPYNKCSVLISSIMCYENTDRIVKLLMEYGAKLQTATCGMLGPLNHAIEYGPNIKLMEYFIKDLKVNLDGNIMRFRCREKKENFLEAITRGIRTHYDIDNGKKYFKGIQLLIQSGLHVNRIKDIGCIKNIVIHSTIRIIDYLLLMGLRIKSDLDLYDTEVFHDDEGNNITNEIELRGQINNSYIDIWNKMGERNNFVVPLKLYCLRAIEYNKLESSINKKPIFIPKNYPKILLLFPDISKVIGRWEK